MRVEQILRVACVPIALATGCYAAHERLPVAPVLDSATADAGPPDDRALCARTGGAWEIGPCCPAWCGAPCTELCYSQACNCGETGTWDRSLGCIIPSPHCAP